MSNELRHLLLRDMKQQFQREGYSDEPTLLALRLIAVCACDMVDALELLGMTPDDRSER